MRGRLLINLKLLEVEKIVMTTPLIRKISSFASLSEEDSKILNNLCSTSKLYHRGRMLMDEGQPHQDIYIMLDGWACSYRQLMDGRRQIINFAIPGDLLGVRNLVLPLWTNSGIALTNIKAARVPQKKVVDLIRTQPLLGAALLAALSRDEAIVVEHLVNIGRRTALERMAHLLMELCCRLQQIFLNSDNVYPLPLSQENLGDALGLSTIHVNRILRQLRERKIVTLAKRKMIVHNIYGLSQIAGFNPEQYQPIMTKH